MIILQASGCSAQDPRSKNLSRRPLHAQSQKVWKLRESMSRSRALALQLPPLNFRPSISPSSRIQYRITRPSCNFTGRKKDFEFIYTLRHCLPRTCSKASTFRADLDSEHVRRHNHTIPPSFPEFVYDTSILSDSTEDLEMEICVTMRCRMWCPKLCLGTYSRRSLLYGQDETVVMNPSDNVDLV